MLSLLRGHVPRQDTLRGHSAAGQQQHVCRRKGSPPVPSPQQTSVRIPGPLRERVDAYAREHRWSMGEVTRVALERLVGFEHDDKNHEPDRPTAS